MKDKNDIHPEDKRNLIIFIVVAIGVWFLFDAYLLKPKLEELKQVQAEKVETEAMVPQLSPLEKQMAEVQTREQIMMKTRRIDMKNEKVFGTISTKGARIDDLSLQNYFETLNNKVHVSVLSPVGTDHPRYMETGWLSGDDTIKLPNKDTTWSTLGDDVDLTPDQDLTMYWDNGQGLRFEKTFKMDEAYALTVTQRVVNNGDKSVTLFPYALMTQHGLPKELYGRWIVHEGPIGYMDGELVELSYKKIRKKGGREIKTNKGWIGLTERYWFTGMIPEDEDESFKYRYIYSGTSKKGDQQSDRYQVDKTGDARSVEPGQSVEEVTHLYAGPKEVLVLQEYEKSLDAKHFDLIVDYGMWYFIAKPFFYVLYFIYKIVGNYGLAIVLFTILVRTAAFPLNNISYKSFAKLKKIGPRMKVLREEYGDNKEGMQKELMKLYEEEQVNPMSGCLPIILQIPIFFALYKVLLISIEMRHAPFFGWIKDLSAPDPTTVFNLFGVFDYSVPSFLQIGVWPCLMLFFMLLQRRLHPKPTDPVQQGIADAMPFMAAFILAKFASGLVIYWTFSNAFAVIQQYIIMRSMGIKVSLIHGRQDDELDEEGHTEGEIEDELEEELHAEQEAADKESKPIKPPKPKKKKKK